MKLFRLKAIY